MKYTAKFKQPQMVGGKKLNPSGGELTAEEIDKIKKDPWGKELICTGFLIIDGIKQDNIDGDVVKGAAKKAAPPSAGDLIQTAAEKK
jgi:hypothetical protein